MYYKWLIERHNAFNLRINPFLQMTLDLLFGPKASCREGQATADLYLDRVIPAKRNEATLPAQGGTASSARGIRVSCRAVSLMSGRHSPWSPMGMPPPAFAVVFHALTAGGFPPLLVPDPPYVSTDPCAGLRSYHRRNAAFIPRNRSLTSVPRKLPATGETINE